MIRWLIALGITLVSAYYQRLTGPTYPLKASMNLDGKIIRYRLERSHSSNQDQPVTIVVADTAIAGEVQWRRYPTNETWQKITMQRRGDILYAALPHQPPAGKLEYIVILKSNQAQTRLPGQDTVITRFKGEVPGYFLIPHITFMFLAMLFSTRTGLEGLRRESQPRFYAWATIISLFIGGIIFGSIVQKYAFGAYWTGFPFGTDLTDNKTLIALMGWIAATIAVEKNRRTKLWVLIAAFFMLVIFAIPHSLFGSEMKH